jgi:hypothetical protein
MHCSRPRWSHPEWKRQVGFQWLITPLLGEQTTYVDPARPKDEGAYHPRFRTIVPHDLMSAFDRYARK